MGKKETGFRPPSLTLTHNVRIKEGYPPVLEGTVTILEEVMLKLRDEEDFDERRVFSTERSVHAKGLEPKQAPVSLERGTQA